MRAGSGGRQRSAAGRRGRPVRTCPRRLPLLSLLPLLALLSAPLAAQDTTRVREQGVRVGITYTPGVRPGLLLLGGPSQELLDSVRAVVGRDLDYSDRFEMISLPGTDSLTLGITALAGPAAATGHAQSAGGPGFVNYPLYEALGADYTVSVVRPPDSSVAVAVYDVKGRTLLKTIPVAASSVGAPGFRMALHRASDEVVRVAAGTPGMAASRVLFLQHGRLYRVDADGANPTALTPAGDDMMSPTWMPDGEHMVYTQMRQGLGALYVQDLMTGRRDVVPPTAQLLNYATAVSPDGRTLVFTRNTDEGAHLYAYNLAEHCCLQRLTAGRFSDNLSPTFSPDGRRIAFVSTRAGSPQIYVMSADGTDQQLFAPFDYGVTGSSYAPEWSPDGLHLAFHRDVAGAYQVFVMDVASRTVRQLTSEGSNEDPTWAPDGRHLAFASTRTGARQIWVMDLDTGRVRQLTRQEGARLPSWSPRLADTTNH
jgi:TolB protein